MLEIKFSFKDEFEQVTTLEKTFTDDTLEITPALYLLVEEFKCFLRGMGFSDETIDEAYTS